MLLIIFPQITLIGADFEVYILLARICNSCQNFMSNGTDCKSAPAADFEFYNLRKSAIPIAIGTARNTSYNLSFNFLPASSKPGLLSNANIFALYASTPG